MDSMDHPLEQSASTVWENRRSFFCFGWHGPLVYPRWLNPESGQSVSKGDGRPSTTEYRRVLKGQDEVEEKEWDWVIVVDENTDEFGWQYGGCFFRELLKSRLQIRSRSQTFDLVKRRNWVLRSSVQELESKKRKDLVLLDPSQMRRSQLETKKKLEEAKERFWDLIEELDSSIKFKDLAFSFLNPIALNRVANKHIKAMVNEQKHAITAYPPVTLAASEVWSGEPRVPKWKGNQEPECPSPSSEPPSTPSTPVGGPLRNTLAAMSTAVLSMIKSMSRRQGLRLETRTVSEGAITGGEDVLSPTAKRGEQLPGGRSPERRTGDVDSSQAIHIHSPTVQAPTPQFKSFVTKFKAAKAAKAEKKAQRKASKRFILSLPELECAFGHALAIYGDLENYVDGCPAQTQQEAIFKYTGVAEADVLLVSWKSGPLAPAHYLAIDRQACKIIICVRGTSNDTDVTTTLVCRPENHVFSTSLRGYIHPGILQSAQYVYESVWEKLQEAIAMEPSFPIIATGHSLGGGTAALVALLLKSDERLQQAQRGRVRAVCLAPAAVTDRKLAKSCRGFIASVVLGSDFVPRISVPSVAQFVQEVARASLLKRALVGLRQMMGKGIHLNGKTPFPQLFPPGMILWVMRDPHAASKKKVLSSCFNSAGEAVDAAEADKALKQEPLSNPNGSPIQIKAVSGPSPAPVGGSSVDENEVVSPVPPPVPPAPPAVLGRSEFIDAMFGYLHEDAKAARSTKPSGTMYHLRYVEPQDMSEIRFFKKAVTDHLPAQCLKDMRALVEQQRTEILDMQLKSLPCRLSAAPGAKP